jgi:hypothetical protein
MDKSILRKFNIEEFYDKSCGHFNFNLSRTVLTATLHKSTNTQLYYNRSSYTSINASAVSEKDCNN